MILEKHGRAACIVLETSKVSHAKGRDRTIKKGTGKV